MIRLALIGNHRSEYNEYAVSRLHEACFVAIADCECERATASAKIVGASIIADSIEELLVKHANEFDAVVIRNTKNSHLVASSAADAGKHVLIESSLASSTELADEVIEKCRAANVRLMVGHSQRFLPAVATIKSVLDSGVLGAPGLLRIHHWESSDSNNRLARHRVSSEMDLAIWLFAEPPSQIYALVRGHVATAVESSDYLQVHLGFPDGGMALIDYAATLPHGAGYYSISMIGSTGATYGDDHHNMQLLYGGGEPTALKTAQGCGHLLAQLQEFVDSIVQNRDPAITGADGRLAIQVAQAIDLSISSGRAVHRNGERYELV